MMENDKFDMFLSNLKTVSDRKKSKYTYSLSKERKARLLNKFPNLDDFEKVVNEIYNKSIEKKG